MSRRRRKRNAASDRMTVSHSARSKRCSTPRRYIFHTLTDSEILPTISCILFSNSPPGHNILLPAGPSFVLDRHSRARPVHESVSILNDVHWSRPAYLGAPQEFTEYQSIDILWKPIARNNEAILRRVPTRFLHGQNQQIAGWTLERLALAPTIGRCCTPNKLDSGSIRLQHTSSNQYGLNIWIKNSLYVLEHHTVVCEILLNPTLIFEATKKL